MTKMTEAERLEKIETLNSNRSASNVILAELYENLLAEMGEAITIARTIATSVDSTEDGVPELQQLLTIMDGSFLRKANSVILKNRADTETEDTEGV